MHLAQATTRRFQKRKTVCEAKYSAFWATMKTENKLEPGNNGEAIFIVVNIFAHKRKAENISSSP